MIANNLNLPQSETSIHYQTEGNGEITLLFIHGWCINSHYWEKQIAFFSKKYRVLAMDLPGFGQSTSSRKDWTVENYANDVLSFIKALNLEKVILVGHSMGGEIMLETAISKFPGIIGLIGIDNFKTVDFTFSDEQTSQMKGFYSQLEKDFVQTTLQYSDFMLFQPSTPEPVKNRIKDSITQTNPVIGYQSLANYNHYLATESTKLNQLHLPLHLLNSNAIPTYEPGLITHAKAGHHLYEIDQTGHYPMNEKPEAFNQILSRIIEKIEDGIKN